MPFLSVPARKLRRSTLALCAYAFLLLLPLSAACAQHEGEGPFANLAGTWNGTGTIALSSGSKERIRCQAEYKVATRVNLRLKISCASDSYKFELASNVVASGQSLSGNWDELTRHVAGQISGRVAGNRVEARAEGPTFTALFTMNTRGDRQAVSIESPGSEMAGISITLARRSR